MDKQPLNTGEQKDMTEFFTDLITKIEEMSPDLVSVCVCEENLLLLLSNPKLTHTTLALFIHWAWGSEPWGPSLFSTDLLKHRCVSGFVFCFFFTSPEGIWWISMIYARSFCFVSFRKIQSRRCSEASLPTTWSRWSVNIKVTVSVCVPVIFSVIK